MYVTSLTGWFVTILLCWPSHFISYFSIFRNLPSLCFHFSLFLRMDACFLAQKLSWGRNERLWHSGMLPVYHHFAQLERRDNIAKIPTSGFLIYWSEVNGSSRCWRKSADIYIVQDHQLSGFYVLACILSIHWALVFRPLKALKYRKLHIKYTFF